MRPLLPLTLIQPVASVRRSSAPTWMVQFGELSAVLLHRSPFAVEPKVYRTAPTTSFVPHDLQPALAPHRTLAEGGVEHNMERVFISAPAGRPPERSPSLPRSGYSAPYVRPDMATGQPHCLLLCRSAAV